MNNWLHTARLYLTAAESVEMTAHKRSNPDQKQAVLKRKQALEQKGGFLIEQTQSLVVRQETPLVEVRPPDKQPQKKVEKPSHHQVDVRV